MKNINNIPVFTLHLTEPSKRSWCILLNGKVIHHIENFLGFNRALGYPFISSSLFWKKTDYSKELALLNKHIAKDIQKEISTGTNECLQYKISKYLLKNCSRYQIIYNEYYGSLIKVSRYEDIES